MTHRQKDSPVTQQPSISRLHLNQPHNFTKHSPKYYSEPDIVKNWNYKHLTRHVKLTNANFYFLPQVHTVSLPSKSNIHQLVNKFWILKTFCITEVKVDTSCFWHKHWISLQYSYKQVHEDLVVREVSVLVLWSTVQWCSWSTTKPFYT
jgi:hypothetical protein